MASIAFPDPGRKPTVAHLSATIGKAISVVDLAVAEIAKGHSSITSSWKFSKASGWYVTYDKGKKRLFYLFPKRGDFLIKLVFNDKGIKGFLEAGLPPAVRSKLEKAKKYSEGTLLEFTAHEITAPMLTQLLRIKLVSMAW